MLIRYGMIIFAMMIAMIMSGCGASGPASAGGGGGGTPANIYSAKVYVVNTGSNNVTVIDTANNNLVATIPVGASPSAVAIDNKANRAYISNTGSNNISVIDTVNSVIVGTITTASSPWQLAVNPLTSRLYVSSGNNVLVIDTNTNAVVATLPIGATNDITVNPMTNRLYAITRTGMLSGNISVIDTLTNAVVATIPLPANTFPYRVAVNPMINKIYVTNFLTNRLSVIDGATNALGVDGIVGFYPVGVVANPNDNKVYVANSTISNNISMLDMNGVNMATLAGRPGPEAVAINPLTNYLYIANKTDNSMTVYNTNGATPTPIASYNVGTAPSAIAVAIPTPPRPTSMPPTPPPGGRGDSWDNLTAPYTSVAFGAGLYVAVGGNGIIKTSPDGINWTNRASGTGANLYKVIYGGPAGFVAVGGGMLTSPDGINWTPRVCPSHGSLYGVAWSGTQYMVVGALSLMTSPDGITWTDRNAFGTYTFSYYDVVWAGTQFIVAGQGGVFSSNGLGLVRLAQPNINVPLYTSVSYAASTGVIVVSSALDINTSLDGGVTWTTAPTANITGNSWQDITYNPVLGQFVAVGGTGYSKTLVGANAFFPNTAAVNQIMATSPDGLTWTTRTTTSRNALSAVTSNTLTGETIAVGEVGAVLTSPDTVSWTLQQGGAMPVSRSVPLTSLNDVIWGGPGAGQFVAVGASGSIFTSPNGYTWTERMSGTLNNLKQVIWSGQQFVAVGGPTIAEAILTSPDGVTWTKHSVQAFGVPTGVVWTGLKYIAVDGFASKIESTDGVTWSYTAPGYIPASGFMTGPSIIRWDGYLNRFIHSGNYSTAVNGYQMFSVGTSYDAVTWTAIPDSSGYALDIGYDNTGSYLVAATLYGIKYGLPASGIPLGNATLSGSPQPIGAFGGGLNRIVKTGTMMVAVGNNQLQGRIDVPASLFISTTPATWTFQHPHTSNNLNGIAWNGNVFVAVGDNVILVSP